jgi:homocysteine S-methyltransferase
MSSLPELLARGRPVLLDGATGTELERRGFSLPAAGWSARAIDEAPALLRQIHADYANAGADIVTANTFRLHRRNLADWGHADDQRRLVRDAVRLAREASAGRALVAASCAPIGDCYSPDQVPQSDTLQQEHLQLAAELEAAGVDLVLIETMVSGVESEAAAGAVARTGLPFIVSFVTSHGARLLTGELLGEVIERVLPHRPLAVGVNCLSCRDVSSALDALLVCAGQTPVVVYANTGERAEDGSWRVTKASEPAVYAGLAGEWMKRGVRLIGGCCGTGPDHIRAIQAVVKQRVPV